MQIFQGGIHHSKHLQCGYHHCKHSHGSIIILGKQFVSAAAAGSQQAVDVMGMGGGVEEGDQVVIGGVLTRPSSASTAGQSNAWDVSDNNQKHNNKNNNSANHK